MVELDDHAVEMASGCVERARAPGRSGFGDDPLHELAGDAALQRQGDLRPLRVVEEGRDDRAVVVLDGTAAWLGAGQLDRPAVSQDSHVMAHRRERLVELARKLHGACVAALHEQLDDPPAQRMREGLDQALVQRRGAHPVGP
jgi:hypothetical protein